MAAKKKGAKKKSAPAKKRAKKSAMKAVSKNSSAGHSGIGISPLGDKVIIRVLDASEAGKVLPSGIIIPETVDKEKADRGVVVAVGPGKWNEDGDARIPVTVSVGDKVMFQWGDKIEYQGKEFYLVSENNILAVIN